MSKEFNHLSIRRRFRGFLPVVVDVETGGFNPQTDALLEIACVILKMDKDGDLHPDKTYSTHVLPFENAHLDPEALKFNKIDPYHPFRFALEEKQALQDMFEPIHRELQLNHCRRAVLVGHNAWFDLLFIKAAVARCQIENNPFHAFTAFDTASLAAVAYGQTVLAKAVATAGYDFDANEAHSAIYDAEKTADLFCNIVNRWKVFNQTKP